MADTKISALSAASALTGTEVTPVVQSAATVKATIDQIKAWCSNAPTLVTPVLGVATATSVSAANFYGGGLTSAFPQWLRNGAGWDAKLADNSALSNIAAAGLSLAGATLGGNALAVGGSVVTNSFLSTGSYIQAGGTLYSTTNTSGGLIAGAAYDLALLRLGPANFRQGLAPSATPVPQTFTLGEAAATTDIRGGLGTHDGGGAGTGTGGGGGYKLRTAFAGATGTTPNTYADRLVVAGKQVALTESTATAVLNHAVASGTVCGGTLFYMIRADDGTDFQCIEGRVVYSAVNKAGTVTTGLGTPAESVITSTGTLTVTVTADANGNGVDLKLNAVSSLTQTTLYAFVSAVTHGTGSTTLQ